MANHPVFAALYDLVNGPMERAGVDECRRRLLSRAQGRVLDVGGGTGVNLAHYPRGSVESVTVVEPQDCMRRRLLRRMPAAVVPVEVHEAGIDDAQLADGSFDTVVATFVLCSVPDQATALAKMRSLLKPGGRLLFLEHVRGLGLRRRLQQAVTPLWKKGAGGCDPSRDTVAAIRRAGFTIAECDRFLLPRTWPVVRPAAQGVAYVRAA